MRNKIKLNWDQAHAFVEKNKSQGFFWDGYTIVRWSPSNNGYLEKNGMFRNGRWGYSTRFFLNKEGEWEISEKYAKFI